MRAFDLYSRVRTPNVNMILKLFEREDQIKKADGHILKGAKMNGV